MTHLLLVVEGKLTLLVKGPLAKNLIINIYLQHKFGRHPPILVSFLLGMRIFDFS